MPLIYVSENVKDKLFDLKIKQEKEERKSKSYSKIIEKLLEEYDKKSEKT